MSFFRSHAKVQREMSIISFYKELSKKMFGNNSPMLFYPIQIFLLLVVGCSFQTESLNQQQPLTSPDGNYILTMPIEKNPQYNNVDVWKVTITDNDNQLLYKDNFSEFVGNLNVYWLWDVDNRVWLYNSDTSYVYFWELRAGSWTKSQWGYGKTKQVELDLIPPPELYPSYVK